jgi:hypothetical protein
MDIEGKRRKEGGRKASKGKAKEQGEGRRGAEATTSNPLSRSPGPIRPPEEATAHPRRDQPNVPKRKCREKCPSTTKADRNKPHGRTGQVQQGRPRLPQPDILTAQMRYLRHHVEGGSKSSCQVSPTVTGKGRSAATPNPTRLHWVKCNQGERKEGRAAAGTESSQAQHHQWAGGPGAPRSGPSPTKAVAQAASGAESHSMSIRGSPEIAQ